MLWDEFYDAFWDWSDSTRRTRISSLEDIGTGDEIVEAVLEIEDPKVKAQLIRKAMKLGVSFTQDDFMNLDEELPEELFAQLGEYAGFDADDPYFDEDNMDWDDFYNCWSDWSDEILLRRIGKLKEFGSPDEVAEVILNTPTVETWDLLYEKAVASGVRFTNEQLEEMGELCLEEVESYGDEESTNDFDVNVQKLVAALDPAKNQPKHRTGLIGGLFQHSASSGKKKASRYCDGDCANCPPHFGYRYGRWYFGRGHQYGCMRGGNGGAKGKVSMD